MEQHGLSFGQPVSIVCPVIRSGQSTSRQAQPDLVPEAAVDTADEPRRRLGDVAAGRSSVLRTAAASQWPAAAADVGNGRPVVTYAGKDGDDTMSEPPSPAASTDDDEPPAVEQPDTAARMDPLMILCQAAQQGYDAEESEQQVPLGPEVHFGELSFADASPQNPDVGQYDEVMVGGDDLPVIEDIELPMVVEEHEELPVEEGFSLIVEEVPVREQQRELPAREHPELAVGAQEQRQLPTRDDQQLPAQEHSMLAEQEPPAAKVALTVGDIVAELRPLQVTGHALLAVDPADAHGALTLAIAPHYQGEGATQPATGNVFYLLSATPQPQVERISGEAVGNTELEDFIEKHIRRQVKNLLNYYDKDDRKDILAYLRCEMRKKAAQSPARSGRESPLLRFSTRHGKRQLHLSLDCDESCCKDTLSDASDSTEEICETAGGCQSAGVEAPAAIECRPENAEGESQNPHKEADMTPATPDSTADTQKAQGQDPIPEDPVQKQASECTSGNTTATERESSSPPTAAQDKTETTDTSPVEKPDENLKNSEAEREVSVDDSARSRCCINSEVKNLGAKPSVGRRRKNPIRRHILPATPNSGRKPVARKRGVAALSESVAKRGRRQAHFAEPAPVESERQQKRGRRPGAEQAAAAAAAAAPEKPGVRCTARKPAGRGRGGGAAGGRGRCPAVDALPSPSPSPRVEEASAPTAPGRKKRSRDSAKEGRSRSRDEWMLQPLASQPGQDPPLRLLVKRRTLTVSESSELRLQNGVKEDILSPLRKVVADTEKSKPVQRRRRHSTNDCHINQQESQMNNSLQFSNSIEHSDYSMQWHKQRKPAPLRNVNCDSKISNDADAADDGGDEENEEEDDYDDDNDEDWVPTRYKYRKPSTGGNNNSKRISFAKRRKSVTSGTDELSQIPCSETAAKMTTCPQQLTETNKEESLNTSPNTSHVSEQYKTTAAETVVTAVTDTCKSSVEEHVSGATDVSMASKSPSKYNQPAVSQTQHKVSHSTDEICQEPAPKKYKKAWQELWSAQQNNEQAKALLPQVPQTSKELCLGDERCTREPVQPSTTETSASSSSHVVTPPSPSDMNEQEWHCKGKTSETPKTTSELTEDPHTVSDDSVETLSDTTTDESDNESSPARIQKCRSVVRRREIQTQRCHRQEACTLEHPQGLIAEGLYVLNGRAVRVRVQEVRDGPLTQALSQVPREIIEDCAQKLKRSNELVPSIKYVSPYNLDIKPFIYHHNGNKLECSSYPPSTHIKQELVDHNQLNCQSQVFASSSGIFPYAGQPLGYSSSMEQHSCRRKVCYRRKGLDVENEKHGSQNNDIIEISDSDDECPKNNSAENRKFQGGDEKKKDDDSNDNDLKPPPDLTLCIPWPRNMFYGPEFRQRMCSTLDTDRQSENKEILFEKIKEEYNNGEISFNAAQQGSSSLSQLTKEAYLWQIVSQLTSTEAMDMDRSFHSQKHIDQMTQSEHDIQCLGVVCHSSRINFQSNIFPSHNSERSVFYKNNPKKIDAYLLESPEKGSNSNENDALKIESNLLQSCEVTKQKLQDMCLSNCQHTIQHNDASKSKLAGVEEIVESKNHLSKSDVPEPESLHYAVKNVQSADLQVNSNISVVCSNSLRGEPMAENIDTERENVLMEHSQLVTDDNNKYSEICDGQELANLKLVHSADDINKKQVDDIYEVDMNNVCEESCTASGDTVMKQAVDTHEADTNSEAEKLYETSGNVITKPVDETHGKDSSNEVQQTCDSVMKQTDKPHGPNVNDVDVKERLVSNHSPSNQNSKSNLGIGHSKEESKMELHGNGNGQQHCNTDKQHSLNESIAVSQSKNKQNTEDTMTENGAESKNDSEDLVDKMKVMSKLMQPSELEGMDVNKEKTQSNLDSSEKIPEVDCNVTQCEFVTASSTADSYNNACELLTNAQESVVTASSTADSYNNACELLTNAQESVNLKSVSNVQPEADSTVTVETTCEDSISQPATELSSVNVIDSDLKKKVCIENKSNGAHITHPTVTVNGNSESSRPQAAAKLSDTNLQESLLLKDNSSIPQIRNSGVLVDSSCEDPKLKPVTEPSSSNLSDNIFQEKPNLRNSSNLPSVIDSSVTVDGACEGSRSQPATELSSANLIQQLVQCQQNSRVFDPLVSLIKTRPIVGDFALRYDMMVKRELARLHKKEAKQKEKRDKKKEGSTEDSKTKKKKKKKKKLFPGKVFCGFRDNDKDMDGCGPGKGGFSGGTVTFTAIVSCLNSPCVFTFYDNFLTKSINICKKCKAIIKQSKGLSRTFHIACWLLYFGIQHVCPFTL